MKSSKGFSKVSFLLFYFLLLFGAVLILPGIGAEAVSGASTITPPDAPASFDPISTLIFVAENIGFLFALGSFSSAFALFDAFLTIMSLIAVYIGLALLRGGS